MKVCKARLEKLEKTETLRGSSSGWHQIVPLNHYSISTKSVEQMYSRSVTNNGYDYSSTFLDQVEFTQYDRTYGPCSKGRVNCSCNKTNVKHISRVSVEGYMSIPYLHIYPSMTKQMFFFRHKDWDLSGSLYTHTQGFVGKTLYTLLLF